MLARTVDAIAERGEGLLLLLGRLAIGVLYLPSGFGKLTGINGPGVRGFATYLVAHGVPGPAIAWSGVAAGVARRLQSHHVSSKNCCVTTHRAPRLAGFAEPRRSFTLSQMTGVFGIGERLA